MVSSCSIVNSLMAAVSVWCKTVYSKLVFKSFLLLWESMQTYLNGWRYFQAQAIFVTSRPAVLASAILCCIYKGSLNLCWCKMTFQAPQIRFPHNYPHDKNWTVTWEGEGVPVLGVFTRSRQISISPLFLAWTCFVFLCENFTSSKFVWMCSKLHFLFTVFQNQWLCETVLTLMRLSQAELNYQAVMWSSCTH